MQPSVHKQSLIDIQDFCVVALFAAEPSGKSALSVGVMFRRRDRSRRGDRGVACRRMRRLGASVFAGSNESDTRVQMEPGSAYAGD